MGADHSLNGKKAVAVWVEALDGATAAASIIILFAANDDRHSQNRAWLQSH